MDFTLKTYLQLLRSLKKQDFCFQTFVDFIKESKEKVIILRHDVDLLPLNSLKKAQIEYESGISGTYYFRYMPGSWNENIVTEIAKLGHEIGYHYETMDTSNGDVDKAYDEFCKNLELLRKLVPIKTICMHGSPRSKYDNRDIWKKYDYRKLGIIGEPYFDIDFSKTFYLTDTGRRWDGYKVSVRDKIPVYQERWIEEGLVFKSTQDIINYADKLPQKIMFVVHPQRWHNHVIPWYKELILQNIKNLIKRRIISSRNK